MSKPKAPKTETPAQAPEPLKPPEPLEVGGGRRREEDELGRTGGLNLRVSRPTDNTLGGLTPSNSAVSVPQ